MIEHLTWWGWILVTVIVTAPFWLTLWPRVWDAWLERREIRKRLDELEY